MALLPETATWEAGITQLEETDVVQGGANGIDNLQPKQLANRTLYLKQQIETLGTDKQPVDAILTALAALVTSADKLPYFTGPDAVAMTTLTAFMRTVLSAADATAARATLGAVTQADINAAVAALVASSPAALDTLKELATALGNDPNFATTITNALAGKQAADATLTALSGVVTAADKLIYASGADVFSTTTLTAFMRGVLAAADAATACTAIGAATRTYVDGVAGVGRTWQNMAGSRAFNTPYTNDTGRSIRVKVGFNGSGNLSIGGIVVGGFNGNSTALHGEVGDEVPAGASYSVSCSYSMDFWSELR